MSAQTNPYELVAQWRKAKQIVAWADALGVTLTEEPPSERAPELMHQAAGLASAPSLAVWRLAWAMQLENAVNTVIDALEQDLRA